MVKEVKDKNTFCKGCARAREDFRSLIPFAARRSFLQKKIFHFEKRLPDSNSTKS